MRHRKKNEKFSRSRAQRKALIRSLLRSLVIYESIKTTRAKAKGLRAWADKLIGLGKDNTLHTRRQAYQLLNDHRLVKKVFDVIAPRFSEIAGGYTRIIPLATRPGDGASLALIEFTKREKKEEKKAKKKTQKETEEKKEKATSPESKEKQPKGGLIHGVKEMFKKKSSDRK
ncbi:MAG: 50S ribosomal protein L17 [Candidatus Omnitrophica bacterium]|nr:50S ribosomal protein L17 [Candidatus Omnitrophota bacterium]